MKNSILQGLRLGQKVSKGFRKWLKDKMGKCVNCAKSVMQIFAESAKSAESAKPIFATYATFASANFVGKESNESTVMYRVKSRITTTCLRLASVFTSTRIRLASLICLCMLTIGSGNVWGAITNNNNGTYTETSGTGSFSSNTITWSFAGGNITVVQTATGGTDPNSSYTSAARVYRYNTLTVSASNGFKIEKVEIVCSSTYYGNSIAAGTSVTNNVVGTTSAVTADVTYTSGHTHSFTPATTGAKSLFYIRNVNSGSTNTQLRWASGGLKVTYSYTAPTAVTEGTVTSSSFGLSITDALNTNKYDVYFSTSSTAPTATTSATVANQTTKTPTISSGVSAGQNYYVWVRSVKTVSSDTWKSLWTAMTSNPLSTPSAGTSVSYSKAATTNGSFTLSPASSVTTTSSAQTVTVTCSPNAGYYVSAISATNPATCPSAITYGGSNNSRTVTYPTGANGSSTISVTFSPIWYLKGDFNSWDASIPLTDITSNVATVDLSLSKTTAYEFKVYNAKDDTWYGNNGKIIDDISGWTFSTSEDNCQVFATVADDYTFNFNITNQQMQVIYPDMTHPNDAYVYLTKWWDCYVHYWYTDGGGDHALIDWGYDSQLSRYEEICETDYWCVPILEGYPKLIMKDAAGAPSNTTGDQVTTDHGGKYITHDGSWGWHNFETYTVSYAAGTGGSGSMSSHTDLCPGSNQALSTNTFTQDHYHFSGWVANVDVKIGGATVTAGTLIAGGSTIQDIRSNITLTAQWEINSHTLTWNWNGGSTSSESYTTGGTKNYGTTITYPANNTMNKTGYNFSSWSSSPSGNPTSMPDADLTITANWTAKTYTITLDREGGTTGATSLTMTYNSSSFTGWTAPTKAGYTFGGYYKDDDGTGAQIINTSGVLQASTAYTGAGGIWTNDGAVTLHAKWTAKNYTVTLNDGSGSGGSGSKSVTYNSNTNLTSNVAVPTYTGNDFRGYFTSTGGSGTKVIDGTGAWIKGTSYVDASGNWIYDGGPTLYAYWTAYEYENYRTSCSDMYDIVLDDGLVATTNNGSAKVAANGTTLTSIVAPTKSGYDVEGYYTTSGLATKIATDAGALQNGSGSGITVGGNVWTNSSSQWVRGAGETFYTKWTAHNYTITYEGLEGATNTNPTSYTIETATINLANPGSRTGYTFTGWTLGGSPITQIAVGSTGDKTITANWTINQHAVAVSAVDNVVITATPASEAAIAESASRNVNYNKTITLNCTPDAHWNLVWDVYKTGSNPKETVSLTGSGDGATFTMPDYNVTVSAVMSEDTYHTATFKNNGAVIDGYNAVKTYDGTRPTAPTLTDITDACDKTDCNKFYGWIAEANIWPQTIPSVAGKTIYRNAGDIPVVSGADVVYHAVWAKGSGVSIDNTLIAKWDKQSLTAGSAVKAKDKDGNTLNDVTMTSNISMSSSGVYAYANSSLSTDPVITLAGLDFSDYNAGVITFFARGSQLALVTVDYSTDGGSNYSTDHFTDGTAKNEFGYIVTVPKNTTNVKISYGSNTGNFYFGTVRAYGETTTSYDFTELTSSNTSGWSGADWDGYYLIVGNSNTKALRSDVMEGLYGKTTISPSEGVISTADLGLIFKAKYNSSTTGYAIQSAATQDYLTDNAGGFSEKYHLLETSATEAVSIAYDDIQNASGYYVRWNSDRFGSYTNCTKPTLYKIMSTFEEFRITCCDKNITIGTPTKTGSGTVTFESGGEAVAAGGTVETCEGETTITATVTPTNGYQCTVLSFTRSDSEDLTPDPAVTVPFTGAHSYDLPFEQNADDVTLNTTVTFVALQDHYIDNMHYNATQNKSGNYGTAPTLDDETKGEQCTGLHYKFVGWIPESDMNMTTGEPTSTANMVAGGATGKYATGTNYYAIWAEEE